MKIRERWRAWWDEHGDEPIFETDNPVTFFGVLMLIGAAVALVFILVVVAFFVGLGVLVRAVS